MTMEFHIGPGQTYATTQAAHDAVHMLCGEAWFTEEVHLVKHRRIAEPSITILRMGIDAYDETRDPTEAYPYTIRGYSGALNDSVNTPDDAFGRGGVYPMCDNLIFRDIALEKPVPGNGIFLFWPPQGQEYWVPRDYNFTLLRVTTPALLNSIYMGTVGPATKRFKIDRCSLKSQYLFASFPVQTGTGTLLVRNSVIRVDTGMALPTYLPCNTHVFDNNILMGTGSFINIVGGSTSNFYFRNNAVELASLRLSSTMTFSDMRKNCYKYPLWYIDATSYTDIADWRTATGQDADSFVADPLVDVNGRLLSTSPCIGVGADLSADAVDPFNIDFDGQVRS
jgi:hypothetical protein